MGFLKLFSRIKKAFGRRSARGQRTCPPPTHITITHQNGPRQVDERPVEEDNGRWTWKKMKRCLRWRRRNNNSVAEAERLNQNIGEVHQRIGGHQGYLFSSSEVLTSRDQVLHDVIYSAQSYFTESSSSVDSVYGDTDTANSTVCCKDDESSVRAGPSAPNNTEGVAGPAQNESSQNDSGPSGMPDREQILYRYKIGRELGEGGFGLVHKGIRLEDGLKVAVKFAQKTDCTKYISTDFHPTALPAEIALLLMACRNPGSPHIIKLLDWQDHPQHYVIVMERPLKSIDMCRFLKRNGGVLKESMTQFIMLQVIYAANFCCYRGVFHRDIKLQNLLVNPNTLEVKLIDFGCGDLMKDSSYRVFCGTRPYFPPEYFVSGKYHAKPATVYSLGVLMFTLLLGRFPTADDMSLLSSHQPAFNLSQECCRLMWNCLEPYPKSRIRLEQMHYHDWFLINFADNQSHDQNANASQTNH